MDSFIWPLTAKLKHEAVRSVSNLLRIFGLWSERPYYYPLFAVRTCHFDGVTPRSRELIAEGGAYRQSVFAAKTVLDVLFELVDDGRCAPQVVDFVMDMVYNFVSLADFREEERERQRDELNEVNL